MIDQDQFIAAAAIAVEQHFPKGKCSERGQAMMLVSDLLRYLQSQNAIYPNSALPSSQT